MSGPTPRSQPWPRPDIRIFAAGQVGGFALLSAGWILASGELRPGDQMPALNIGVAGVAVALGTGARFLRRGRRAVAAHQATVSRTLRQSLGAEAFVADIDVHPGTEAGAGVLLVSSDRMTRYHRAGCQLAAGKATVDASRRAHEAAGRRQCGVCQP